MNEAPDASSLDALIDAAVEYAYPLWEIARTRHVDLTHPDPALRIAPNAAWHDRRLCDHAARWITTPNNDTLYSRAWIDLTHGPVRVEVDRMPAGRYWSVAFLDAYSNNFAMIGTRLDGVGPVALWLVGPRHAGPLPEGRVIRAPGDDVWLFGRWIVDGPLDLPNSHAMQDGLRVSQAAMPASVRHRPSEPMQPANFLAVVNEQLARNPPPHADAALLARCAPVGLRAGADDAWSTMPAALREAWTARLPLALLAVRRSMARLAIPVQGWMVRGPEIGNFGTHYALRAAIALGGLAALEPVEAVYATRNVDDAGERLDGRCRYRLRIASAGLPTDAFWSLSMYEATPDGRLFFTDNPIGRYTIGDRTPGLAHAADGALEVALEHAPPPEPAARANWLPAPAGPFILTLRAYLPRPALREWRTELPRLQRLA